MKQRLVGFVEALRGAGVACSVSESLDAVAAVSAAGVERRVMREALAATLVKDHADRPTFDEVFERYFAVPGRQRGKGQRPQPSEEGEGRGHGEGEGRGEPRRDGKVGRAAQERRQHESRPAQLLAHRRALRSRPFREMSGREVEEAEELLEEIGRRFRSRWSRRRRRATRGRLDMRRTIRRAMGRGGVPLELLLRRPRPGKSNLVALVDLSHSTETAARFLLALLAPARRFFRRVTMLAYVDACVEVSFESGHVVPHAGLDLQARSDFGRVLEQVGAAYGAEVDRDTVFLVLGDARNNRRPPRIDLLARLHRQARTVVWLNPDPPERWNTGDSVMATYAREIDVLLAAHDLRSLEAALSRLVRAAA